MPTRINLVSRYAQGRGGIGGQMMVALAQIGRVYVMMMTTATTVIFSDYDDRRPPNSLMNLAACQQFWGRPSLSYQGQLGRVPLNTQEDFQLKRYIELIIVIILKPHRPEHY